MTVKIFLYSIYKLQLLTPEEKVVVPNVQMSMNINYISANLLKRYETGNWKTPKFMLAVSSAAVSAAVQIRYTVYT